MGKEKAAALFHYKEEKSMRIIWKSAVSLALVASMAAGMMLPVSAAAATGLDVENAVTLEANQWYTPLARRMAGAGVIGGQTSGYDPANPYVNVNVACSTTCLWRSTKTPRALLLTTCRTG